MAAANTDHFRESAPQFSTTLNGAVTSSSATIVLQSVANLPTGTGISLVIDAVSSTGVATPSLQETIVGVVSSGTVSIINALRGVEGTAQSHATGANVYAYVTAADWNALMAGLLVQHNQDGSHGAVTATSIATAGYSQSTGSFAVPAASIAPAALATGIDASKLYNPYKFSAWGSTLTTLGANFVATKITFGTKEYDIGSNFDAVTNNRFVATVAGFYQFSAAYGSRSGASGEFFAIYLYKNGTLFKEGTAGPVLNLNEINLSVAPPPFQLAANDYIEVWGATNSTGARDTEETQSATYFGGFLVSET